jgi:catechol 2,3-dioxygenase-like lactoylglutathione lyase family enzyme
MSDRIQGLHHITLCTGTAQGDANFFVKVLGMSLVKRTLLYDGVEPVYHLYFANESGDPGTLTTCFPWRRTGRKARAGTGQISLCSYTVPKDALAFWQEHLTKNNVKIVQRYERFGEKVLKMEHPDCPTLHFELVENGSDKRAPYKSSHIPQQYAIRGFHSWTVSLREFGDMPVFLDEAWNHKKFGTEGEFTRYTVDDGGAARIVDLWLRPDVSAGNWAYGEGMVHHGAFGVPNLDVQDKVKSECEGLGFTDCSDRKHRGYFQSVYVRTPAGALFEATHTLGFTVDEPADKLGRELIVSPQFAAQKDELLRRLNDPLDI